MRVLVTGADGFVGGYLVPRLVDRGHQVLALHGPRAQERPRADLQSRELLRREIGSFCPEVVVHLAGQSSVKRAWDWPQLTVAVNVIGTLNLWEVAAQEALCHFIYVSSAEVYGDRATIPITEDHPVQPMNPYAVSKVAAEELLNQLNERSGRKPRLTILRPFAHVGPGQSEEFAVASFARQVREAGQHVYVGNLAVVRDFLDVRDVVEAYCLAVESPTLSGTFNIASGVGRALKDVLGDLMRLAQREQLEVRTDPTRLRPREARAIVGNAERFQAATGWAPKVAWEDTLKDILLALER
ncbi:MAG: GDP-mannose 4,6-dehydratase [Firmicutes bacterium]|nr:GDP-mannose 4,6-dehydratase [Bacillota bacterium]